MPAKAVVLLAGLWLASAGSGCWMARQPAQAPETAARLPVDIPAPVPPVPDTPNTPAGWHGTVNVDSNIRTGPGLHFPVVRVLPAGTAVVVAKVEGEWLALDGGHWIFGSLVNRHRVPEAPAAPGPAVPADTAPLAAPPDAPALRLYMLELINRERTAQGLAPLGLAHNAGAQFHAADMVANRYIAHWNLRGESPHVRHTRAGGHDYSAENLAYSTSPDASGRGCLPAMAEPYLAETMAGLMASPGHRRNILDPLHREVSIGLAAACQARAVVQLFEGEYIRFSEPPSLTDGRLAMAGRVLGAVLDDRTTVTVAWEPPPAAYTAARLLQTECHSGGPPVVRVRRPPPAGHAYRDGGESLPEIRARCPAPWDVDPHLRLPADAAAIAHRNQQVRDGFRLRETVAAPWVTAAVWELDGDRFRIEADLDPVVRERGPGIYTVVLTAAVDGVPRVLTRYALAVGE